MRDVSGAGVGDLGKMIPVLCKRVPISHSGRWAGFLIAILLAGSVALSQSIPLRAHKYRRPLRQQVNLIWGIGQSADIFAAQIHQESAWLPLAESRYARGLSQFTPDTERWISSLDRSLGAGAGALDSSWSLRALVYYDQWLWKRTDGTTSLDHWAHTLAGYNGGLGWVRREQDKAVSDFGCSALSYWSCTRCACLRHPSNCDQTADYVDRILFNLKQLYWGW